MQNPYTWVNLTNVVWVEQPVGTGFSQGKPDAKDEHDVAQQFMGFFKNFVDTFALQGRKVYITGESYAGYYVPYIAYNMLNANDTEYYNVESIMFYDPSTSYDAVQDNIPALPFAQAYPELFNLNETFLADLTNRSEECGYTQFMDEYLVYPAAGPLPTPPHVNLAAGSGGKCDLWGDIINAVSLTNPCFDVYQVATTCPLLWDVLGFPGSFDYVPEGANIYFNRTDVQMAINAPLEEWEECTDVNV